jgi:hypothetical protein
LNRLSKTRELVLANRGKLVVGFVNSLQVVTTYAYVENMV